MSCWKKLKGSILINKANDEEVVPVIEAFAPPDPQPDQDQPTEANAKKKGKKSCTSTFCAEDVRIIYVVMLCICLGVLVPYLLAKYAFSKPITETVPSCFIDVSFRFPCPINLVTNDTELFKKTCLDMNCCFDTNYASNIFSPSCFHQIPSAYGYIVNKEKSDEKSITLGKNIGDTLTLDLNSFPELTENSYGGDLINTTVHIERCSNSIIRIRMNGINGDNIGETDCLPPTTIINEDPFINFTATREIGHVFNIRVFRTDEDLNTTTLLQTALGPIQYGSKLRIITTTFASRNVYGLGQTNNFGGRPDFSYWGKWSIFAREGGNNVVGTGGGHPFAMVVEKTGNVHGIYFHNPGPHYIDSVDIPGISLRSVSGWIDIRVFGGPTPADVSRQYASLIGRPSMPPYWALGYFMCRETDETNVEEQKEIYDNITRLMAEEEVPYEGDCINSRVQYPQSWGSVQQWVSQRADQLKNNGRKFIQVTYPFMPSSAFPTVNNIVKTPENKPYYGKIVNDSVVYLDFLSDQIAEEINQTPDLLDTFTHADGVMLLRNSPLNEIQTNLLMANWTMCTEENPEYCCPPYIGDSLTMSITDGTICWGALHARHPSNASTTAQHLSVHNTYGLYHSNTVAKLLNKQESKRRLILSSTTSPGSGAIGGYLEENFGPDFVAEQMGLMKIMEMGLYGIPLAGIPICGSIDPSNNETEKFNEWCLRAHQTGAFYPFMMSYYQLGQTPRHPIDFTSNFAGQLKIYIKQRYMFMPFIYTLFKESTETSKPVVRPLFYEFHQDEKSLNIDDQFLLGNRVLVAPVYRSIGATVVSTRIYFPPGCWYNLYSGLIVSNNMTSGTAANISTLLNEVNVFLKGGLILPLQGNLHDSILSSKDARQKEHHLIVCLPCNEDETATGELYQDDGESVFIDHSPPDNHNLITFTATNTTLTVTKQQALYCNPELNTSFSYIKIYGTQKVNSVTVNGHQSTTYNQDSDTLVLTIELNYNWCTDQDLLIAWET